MLQKIAKLAQAGVFGVSDYDVVENFDFYHLASADQIAGDFYIGFAGRGFSTGVVVHKDDRSGRGHNG